MLPTSWIQDNPMIAALLYPLCPPQTVGHIDGAWHSLVEGLCMVSRQAQNSPTEKLQKPDHRLESVHLSRRDKTNWADRAAYGRDVKTHLESNPSR